MKNKWSKVLAIAGAAVLLSMGSQNVMAQGQGRQGRGNFDPEQFRERMMSRMREQLDVKDDAEWKIIETRLEKVMEARREAGPGGGGFGAFGRGPRGGGDQGGGGGGRRGFGPEPSPEQEALQKAIESNASTDEIKAKLAKVRAARQQKEAELEKAQADLKQVLSAKQEAQCVLMGMLR